MDNHEWIKKKRSLIFLLVVALLILPSISALTITDTTFFSSVSNYTIFVDRIVLDNVTVTSGSIQFHELNSTGSNFTNTNITFDAVASFFDLQVGLTVKNVNTSTNLFTSTISNQDFNATIIPGQTIQTLILQPSEANTACLTMVAQFGAFPVLIGLLGTIILLGAVIFSLISGFASLKGEGISGNTVFFGMLTLVSLAILVIVAIVIFGSLCVLL